jgi:hypothetical protein
MIKVSALRRGEDVEGSGQGLISGTVQAFSSVGDVGGRKTTQEKLSELPVSLSGFEPWTSLNMKQTFYSLRVTALRVTSLVW